MAKSWTTTTQYQTWRPSPSIYMGSHTLANLNPQMSTTKLNMTKKPKIYAQSTHLRECSRCAEFLRDRETLLQSSRIASNQHSKESKLLYNFKTMCRYMKLPRSSSTRECLQSRLDSMRKTLLLMRKNLTQNQSIGLLFWDTPFQRREWH